MDTIKDKTTDILLDEPSGEIISPEHREWMSEQILNTLEKKKSGDVVYTPLNHVRRKFGFDAS